ncbi:DMT family transporter [Achromobacter aloeverae]|uniref:EamA family transporter n=1 Tax=Achromobacter aloeverae TaxID=1750518 RepID=A0A4V1MSW0_9BURK|nr:DMT family transporter [Achromobacter aloeverae]RXN93410.1 EamA family transporter [Achromobacter aloeverae]
MTVSTRHPSPLAGIACVTAGIFCLTLSDAQAKWLGQFYSPIQILFMRAAIALPVVLAAVTALGGRRSLRTQFPWIHLLRGALNMVSASCFYIGLRHLPLAENTAIAFAAPLFVTALSVLALKEQVDGARWMAVAAGFAGVLVIVRPTSSSFDMAALWPLATALLYAVMMITARAIGGGESMLTTMFYIVAAQCVWSALAVPWFWTSPAWDHAPYFAGVALCSTLGLTLITQGFRIGPASVVAPFDYTGLIWATLLGWAIWNEQPDLATCAGAVFIAGSGVYIALRERRQGRRR